MTNNEAATGYVKQAYAKTKEKKMDLWAIIDQIEFETGHMAQPRNLFLDFYITPETPRYFQGEPWLLQNVIHLLVEACLRSVKAGGVTVRIEAVGHDEFNRRQLDIAVTDTGPGIHPCRMTNILQSSADKARPNGVCDFSASLFFVKRLARRLNGDIALHSVYGWGTRLVATVFLAEAGCPSEVNNPRKFYSEFILTH